MEKEVKKGDPIKASEFNQLLAEVRKLKNLTVAPPLTLVRTSSGIKLMVQTPKGGGASHIAKLLETLGAARECNVEVVTPVVNGSTGFITSYTDTGVEIVALNINSNWPSVPLTIGTIVVISQTVAGDWVVTEAPCP